MNQLQGLVNHSIQVAHPVDCHDGNMGRARRSFGHPALDYEVLDPFPGRQDTNPFPVHLVLEGPRVIDQSPGGNSLRVSQELHIVGQLPEVSRRRKHLGMVAPFLRVAKTEKQIAVRNDPHA